MKRRNVAFDSTTYSALYKSQIADPRKAIGIHEFARSQAESRNHAADAASSSTSIISDESIRILVGVLMFGGGKEFHLPGIHIQRSGPILAYRASSTGTKPALLDIASVVEDLYRDLEAFDVRASRDTLLAFVYAFGVFGEKGMVEHVHKRLSMLGKHKGYEFTVGVYETLMDAHEACGNFGAVVRLFEGLESSGLPIQITQLNTCLRSLSALHQPTTLLHTFTRVASKHPGIHPTDQTIDLLLTYAVATLSPPASISLPYLTSVQNYLSSALDFSSPYRTLTLASYVSLITTACTLSHPTAADTAYTSMKSLLTLRNSTSPTPTFTSLTALASLLSLKSESSLETAASFFRSEILSPQRVLHHWQRIHRGWTRNLSNQLNSLQHANATSTHASPNQFEISRLESSLANGVPLRTGRSGPFQKCYEAIDCGFRKGLDARVAAQGGVVMGSGLDSGEELMRLAETLEALEREEGEMVVKCCQEAELNVSRVGSDE
ncbi:hypothetical protein HDU98_009549 [Podochytrium sp. JEL0797]|nr:hypothetical protein HDU98_009549 [Podochytrium sp. JEL0797]